MNLAETAFLRPGAHGYRLRWFTRAVEVDLRGRLQLAGQAVTVPRGELLD
jgi:predicted PhzF superfamily epimerase YddE/YHI9